jgi:CRISPR-associated protein Csy3
VARNICNGSWLWRNRVMAQDIRVEVFHNDNHLASFDALSIPLNKFGDYSTDEKKVANVLAAGMRGDRHANLEIRAFLKFGIKGSVELFPSQAYIEKKSSGYARVLYKIDGVRPLDEESKHAGHEVLGQAGLRDQKISNRLRTIDTWCKDYELIGKAIPVEPNGANLDLMQFFRKDRKDSAFAMLSRLNELDPNSPDGMFTIAIMMRGGVLGESDRNLEKSGKKAGKGKGKAGKAEEGRDPAAAE